MKSFSVSPPIPRSRPNLEASNCPLTDSARAINDVRGQESGRYEAPSSRIFQLLPSSIDISKFSEFPGV